MTQTALLRIAALCAGLMGAAGVILAAASAHQPDAARLSSASSMLLFHAPAVIGTALLSGHGILKRPLGFISAFGFVAGTALFAGDLAARQYLGHSLFSMAAPTGGTTLILSWLVLAVAAVVPQRKS
jgi:uncharacterized membrane protein YgdD (TMEM256/DUF423 family)